MRRQKRLNPVVVALLVDKISDRYRFLGLLKPLMEDSGEAVQERSSRARRVLWKFGIVSASRASWLGRLADGTDTVAQHLGRAQREGERAAGVQKHGGLVDLPMLVA